MHFPRADNKLKNIWKLKKLKLQNVTSVPVAQWIARWTSNPKVPGSNPGWDDTF